MNLNTTTRIPVNDEYAGLVGKAVYVFAYYEWTIIYIIDYLKTGFVSDYSRGKPKTSGAVRKDFRNEIDKITGTFNSVSRKDFERCYQSFDTLIEKRNALIHAHPITDTDGSQILAYQASPNKPISDFVWPTAELENLVQEIDRAAIEAGAILDKLK